MSHDKKIKRRKLTTQWTNLYLGITLIFVLGFVFFLTSKVFIADKVDVLFTELGEEYNLNAKGKFTIKEWIFDEESRKMQITLITSDMTSYLSDLNFAAVSRANLKKELPTDIKYESNDIYIIHINEVPENFQQVALRLIKSDLDLAGEFNGNEISEKENVITSIYTDQSVVKKSSITDASVKQYAIKVTDEMIYEAQAKIVNNENQVNKNIIIIGKINEEIANLKSELLYQTLDEQTLTNNKIYNLEKEIASIERENETQKTDIEILNSKIERLTQRKRDLGY